MVSIRYFGNYKNQNSFYSVMNVKEKIINYSKKAFFKNGFYKITMDEIAANLKISKKTIYKYFPSKRSLVDAVVSDFQDDFKININNIVNIEENSILKIKTIVRFFAELSLKIDEKLLYDLQNHRPDLWQQIDEFRNNMIKELWVEIINTGKKEKCIIDEPNEIIIAIILSFIRGLITPTFLLNHNYSIKEAFEILFTILTNGILTEKGKNLYFKSITELENEKE